MPLLVLFTNLLNCASNSLICYCCWDRMALGLFSCSC